MCASLIQRTSSQTSRPDDCFLKKQQYIFCSKICLGSFFAGVKSGGRGDKDTTFYLATKKKLRIFPVIFPSISSLQNPFLSPASLGRHLPESFSNQSVLNERFASKAGAKIECLFLISKHIL